MPMFTFLGKDTPSVFFKKSRFAYVETAFLLSNRR